MTAAVLVLAWVLSDPPPGDAWRIPPVAYLKAGCDFNRLYQAHLRKRIEWEPYHRGELYAALAEAEALYRIYDDAWGAHPSYQCSPTAKADYLRRFRLSIGREAYERMELPTCVPVWHFGELR